MYQLIKEVSGANSYLLISNKVVLFCPLKLLHILVLSCKLDKANGSAHSNLSPAIYGRDNCTCCMACFSCLCDYHYIFFSGCITYIYTGFESSDSSELLLPQVNFIATIPNHLSPPQNPYGGCSSLNYWADENSLYHSALIYPPPLLDPSVSFSEPYLHRTSR